MVVSLQIGRALTDTEIGRHAKGLMTTAAVLTAQLGGITPDRAAAPASRSRR